MRYRATLLLSILALGLTGCFSTVGKRKLVLPPPAPVVEKPLPEPQIEEPPDIETVAIQLPAPLVSLQANPPIETATQETSPQRPATRPRRSVTTTPAGPTEAETPPVTTITPPPPVPPTTPQLGEILTDDRRRQYEIEFADSMNRAKDVVARANGRRLNLRQREAVQRIKTFLMQAEESKVKDLVTACSLAHRADLLGQDLLKTLP
jgi:hypothetical protein